MHELIERMTKALVDAPDEVNITEVETKQGVTYQIRVAPDDLGKVIGKQGRIANALRTLTKAVAMKDKRKVYVVVIE